MRKVIVELKVKEEFLEMLDFLLDKTESIELIELIKLDFEQGMKLPRSKLRGISIPGSPWSIPGCTPSRCKQRGI